MSQVRKVGEVRENARKVSKFFYFDLNILKLSFCCDREAASINRVTGNLKLFSELDGRTAEKMIAFVQEKLGRSQEISKVRSCDNPAVKRREILRKSQEISINLILAFLSHLVSFQSYGGLKILERSTLFGLVVRFYPVNLKFETSFCVSLFVGKPSGAGH